MNYKVYIGGRFKFGTLINDVEHEYDAEHSALMDFYDRHPDLEIDSVELSVEKVEDKNLEEDESQKR